MINSFVLNRGEKMLPYFICSIISCCCIKIGTKLKKTKTDKENLISIGLYLIAAIVPSLLAGFRDNTIGTDVQVYGDSLYIAATNTKSFIYFLKNVYPTVEPLFRAVVYLSSIPQNRVFYYFCLEFSCVVPVLYFLVKNFRHSAYLGMAFYYLWLYGFSFNIMRQAIALSIILFGTPYILARNFKKYAIVILIAYGFHRTGLIGIIPYVMYGVLFKQDDFLNTEQKIKRKRLLNLPEKAYELLRACVVILIVFCIINIKTILSFIVQITGLYSAHLSFINDKVGSGPMFFLVSFAMLLVLWYISKVQRIEKKPDMKFYLYISGCGVILFYISAIISSLSRISLYFSMYIIPYAAAAYLNKKKGSIYYLSVAILCILAALYIYDFYILKLWNEIYPYKSSILGIG